MKTLALTDTEITEIMNARGEHPVLTYEGGFSVYEIHQTSIYRELPEPAYADVESDKVISFVYTEEQAQQLVAKLNEHHMVMNSTDSRLVLYSYRWRSVDAKEFE